MKINRSINIICSIKGESTPEISNAVEQFVNNCPIDLCPLDRIQVCINPNWFNFVVYKRTIVMDKNIVGNYSINLEFIRGSETPFEPSWTEY